MFAIFMAISLIFPIVLAMEHGARKMLWIACPCALLFLPVWMFQMVGALKLDPRFGAFLGIGIGFLLAPERSTSGTRWTLSDLLMLVLIVVQVISESQVGQVGTFTVPEILRQWGLPYIMGRIYLTSSVDIARALRPLSKCLLVITVFAMVEAVTKFHVVNRLLGHTYGLLEQGEGYRMGLKRAQGMADHPIYFGMMMVMFLPWAIEAARRSREGVGPRWWRFLPWLLGGALIGSVSRGPQLSALFTCGASFFFRHPRWRPLILVAATIGGVLAFGAKEVIVENLQAVAGESEENALTIMVAGEEEIYTGTRHRVLLFKVYAEALDNAGVFGWGQKMSGIVLEESIAERFSSIDSHYVMFFLQRGYSGLIPFVLLQFCTLGQLLRLALRGEGPIAGLAGSLFGAMAGLDIGFFSVWFSPDYGAVWLFCCGLSARLSVLRPEVAPEGREKPLPLVPKVPEMFPRLRLFPGAAPPRPPELSPLPSGREKPLPSLEKS